MQFCSKEDIKDYIDVRKAEIKKSVQKNTSMGFDVPTLAIIQVGDNPASNKYVGGKIKDCEEVGIKANLHKFNEDISALDFGVEITKIMHDEMVHAAIIQKPLPDHLEKHFDKFIRMIPKKKDVDGFRKDSTLEACTPAGIVKYIEDRKGRGWFTGKNAVIVGRSELVGRPLFDMLLNRDCTVTVCHSKTKNLKDICKNADLIVSAVGKYNLINKEFIKDENTVVINVGFDFVDGKMVGDVDVNSVKEVTEWCTPIVGSTGLLTRLALLRNTMEAYENQKYRISMIPKIEKGDNNVDDSKRE